MNAENTSRKHTLSRSSIVLICLFAVYAVLTFIGAANHEIWYDEAQAWCIARDNDIPGIITAMRTEGHPPLWHFVLYPFTRMGFTADIMPFISWFITMISAGLMLWKAPFRPVMKAVILFSSGFLFYNSVGPRVYCLILLILTLIAVVYRRRNDFPIVYGILVGLLADTHLLMCGLVGILGIFMIIDLVKLWRSSTALMNLRRVLGLIAAGAGVLVLILPIIGSISSNDYATNFTSSLTVSSAINKFMNSFASETSNAMLDVKFIIQQDFSWKLCAFIGLAFIVMLILLRHYRKHLVVCLFFTFFYCVICEVIWFSLPSRAGVFLYCYAVIYWLAVSSEEPVYKEPKPFKNKSVNGHAIVKWLRARDRDFQLTYCAVFCIYSAMTIPIGFISLFNDYAGDFSYSKLTADYIRENLEPDAVLVFRGNDIPVGCSAYLPEHRFYSMLKTEFLTYSDQHTGDENADLDCAKIYDDLKDCPNIYMMNFSMFELDPDEYPGVLLSRHGTFSTWTTPSDRNINLYRLDLEEFIKEETEG